MVYVGWLSIGWYPIQRWGESLMNWIICGANTTMSGMLSELSLCSCLGFGCLFLFDLFALKSFILRLISIVSAWYLNSKSVFRREKIFPNSRNCKLLWLDRQTALISDEIYLIGFRNLEKLWLNKVYLFLDVIYIEIIKLSPLSLIIIFPIHWNLHSQSSTSRSIPWRWCVFEPSFKFWLSLQWNISREK